MLYVLHGSRPIKKNDKPFHKPIKSSVNTKKKTTTFIRRVKHRVMTSFINTHARITIHILNQKSTFQFIHYTVATINGVKAIAIYGMAPKAKITLLTTYIKNLKQELQVYTESN